MTPKQAVGFVKTRGVVLESGRGPVPNLAEAIAGAPIRGSWWAHPKGHDIFLCSRAIRESRDVLVCRLVGGKVTYIHRRLWPALVRLALDTRRGCAAMKSPGFRAPSSVALNVACQGLAKEFHAGRLAAVQEVHTPSGKHKVHTTPFPDWVPEEVMRAARQLTREEAARLLQVASSAKASGRRRRRLPTRCGGRPGRAKEESQK